LRRTTLGRPPLKPDNRVTPLAGHTLGLGTIVAITKLIRDREGSLRITCPSPRMLKVFQYGGLSDAYAFYDSPEEATLQAPSPDGLASWPGPQS
ncbi:STAS domain-containing protein, partial [Streptomyces sp. MK5]|uniref:STAS domain-containing protein n=1 Tax=Streptomyces sp. MK5 TaxID=3064253 RepID=UPI0035568E55